MQPTRSTPPRSILVHAGAAALLYGVDAFVLSQGALAGVVTFVMVVLGIIHIVRGLLSDRWRIRFGLSMIAIYVVMMASVVVTIRANNRLAGRRAEEVVAALKVYRARTGDYPVRLADLVPGDLPSVPRSKYTLLFNEFSYHYDPATHQGFLLYEVTPPFGRRTYRLDTGTWGYLD
jgi:hypothetical protein